MSLDITKAISAVSYNGTNIPLADLPTSISKIDGGSFILLNNTNTPDYLIHHNLGEIPKGFCVWTNDETSASKVDIYALVNAFFQLSTHETQVGTEAAGYITMYYRITTGKTAGTSHYPTTAQLGGYVTTTTLNVNNNSIKYRAENTYNWIAWA